MTTETGATTTTANITWATTYNVAGSQWGAYAVRSHDGGLSWKTYDTPAAAKSDGLWRRGASIIAVRISTEFEVEKYQPSEAELLIDEISTR